VFVFSKIITKAYPEFPPESFRLLQIAQVSGEPTSQRASLQAQLTQSTNSGFEQRYNLSSLNLEQLET
jgi:hypothetical protein